MYEQLQAFLNGRVHQCVSGKEGSCQKIEKKKEMHNNRNSEIVKAEAKGFVRDKIDSDDHTVVLYDVHFRYFIKQKHKFFVEEEIERREAIFYKETLMKDDELPMFLENSTLPLRKDEEIEQERVRYRYNRRLAVQYAERWWNSYNPKYVKFEVDCTNYISQCLHAGGAPMRGYPVKSKGWWMQNQQWSYSWSVANSLRWYLSSSRSGLRAREVQDPSELQLGDVICYDFQGDGRFDHTTIVTGKDAFGMPLVNAHSTNSRMRYWSYEDSTAYTPNIQYKFFTIVDDE